MQEPVGRHQRQMHIVILTEMDVFIAHAEFFGHDGAIGAFGIDAHVGAQGDDGHRAILLNHQGCGGCAAVVLPFMIPHQAHAVVPAVGQFAGAGRMVVGIPVDGFLTGCEAFLQTVTHRKSKFLFMLVQYLDAFAVGAVIDDGQLGGVHAQFRGHMIEHVGHDK